MESSTVTVKGQVVIPSGIRRRHRITKGTRICFVERGDEIVLKAVTDEEIDKMYGFLKTRGPALRFLLAERKRDRRA